MAEFVSTYTPQLRLVSYVLGAFSLLFGAKALGRFPMLTKPGGFYARVLVAIPAGVFLTATNFVYLSLAPGELIRGLSDALQYPITTVQLAVLQGIIVGLLPSLMNPRTYRPSFGAKNLWSYAPAWIRWTVRHSPVTNTRPGVQNEQPSTPQVPLGCSRVLMQLVLVLVFALPVMFVMVVLISQYVFVILGWFGGHRPSLPTLLIVTGILSLDSVFAAISLGMYSYLIDRAGCVALFILAIVYSTLISPVLLAGVGDVALTVYIARQVGWVFILYLVATQLGEYVLMAVRGIADRLGTRTLLSIFAVPGAIAALIQFAVANNNLLPR